MKPDPEPGEKSATITVKLESGELLRIRRDHAIRISMARQLASMIMSLATEVHRTDKGQKIDLDGNPQWKEVYACASPDIRIASSAQVGKTLYGTCRMFAGANLGLEGAWVSPTDPKRNEYVHNRVERTIQNTDLYGERIAAAGGSNSTHEKQYRAGDGSLTAMHFVTSNSPKEMISFSADHMCIDERDFSDRSNLHMYPARMNRSPYRLTYECSTPTLPGEDAELVHGREPVDNIMTQVMTGDYRNWHTMCQHCGTEQVLDWYKHMVKVDLDDAGRILRYDVCDRGWSPGSPVDLRAVCQHCHRPMDRLGPGRWVKRNPGRQIHSFHLNRLASSVGDPMDKLLKRFAEGIGNPSKMQQFHNMDLGVPFAGGHMGFRDWMFTACSADSAHAMLTDYVGPATAGIDVNVPFFDVQISRWEAWNQSAPQVKLYAGKVQGRQNLYALLKRFGVVVAMIDQQPELNLAVEIQEEAPFKIGCEIIRAHYSTHGLKSAWIASEGPNRPMGPPRLVTLDRTATLDALYASVLNRRVQWFRNFREAINGEMLAEMSRPVRQVVQTDDGERFAWVGKPDHQMHAANLDRMAGEEVCPMMLVRHTSPIGVKVDRTSGSPRSRGTQTPEAQISARHRSVLIRRGRHR